MARRPPLLICVVGNGHSGSTLLDALLGNPSRMTGAGEWQRLSRQPDRPCGCGRALDGCPFWSGVAARLGRAPWRERLHRPPIRNRHLPSMEQGVLFAGNRGLLGMLAPVRKRLRELVTIAEANWRVLDGIAAFGGTDVVVDTSKDTVRMKNLYLAHPSRTRVLHIVRDGRAVAASYKRREGRPVSSTAATWNRRNRNVEMMLATVPSRRKMRLRYEDLCRDTDASLATVCKLVGLGPEEGTGRLGVRDLHSIPGNPGFFERRETTISLDERWRSELDRAELAGFERIAGRRNRRYGYDA